MGWAAACAATGSTGGSKYTQTTMSYARDRSALVMDALCAARDKQRGRDRDGHSERERDGESGREGKRDRRRVG